MSQISTRLLIISALFVTCLIAANIIIVKQISVGPFLLPAAIIIFPLNYILSDVLTEVYGYRQARRVIWLGFVCNLVFVAAIWIAGMIPAASVFEAQAAYERILGNTPRFLLASFAAYLIGEFANAYVLAKMKIATRGKWLWTRTIGSTVVGQGLDTVVVLTIGFIGVLPYGTLFILMLSHWIAKCIYEIVATPLTYFCVNYLKKKEGMDTFDYGTDFNPVKLG